MLAAIDKALKPAGKLVIVEYYKRPEAMPNGRAMTHIRIDMADVIKEVEANRFHLVSEKETIKNVQYMLVLEKSSSK
jgi:predicted methyltransferase